ncbi:MAG: hypothetical protein ACXWLR_15375 [Myxococcales bacterium]
MRERGAQGGERQVGHALGRRGIDGDPGGREIPAEEVLHEKAAEGVADEDGLLRERLSWAAM